MATDPVEDPATNQAAERRSEGRPTTDTRRQEARVALSTAVTSTTSSGWWVPEYARMCGIDSSSRIRLAGLPIGSLWRGYPTDLPGVVRLRRLPEAVPRCLRIDSTARLRLPEHLRLWLTLSVHLVDYVSDTAMARTGTSPVRQVVVVAAAPYESIAIGATWILSPLLGLPAAEHDLALAT